MTREEEKIQASFAYNEQHGKLRVFGGSAILSEAEYTAFNKNPDFIAGATWADENPKEGMVSIDKICQYLNDNNRRFILTEADIKELHKVFSNE